MGYPKTTVSNKNRTSKAILLGSLDGFCEDICQTFQAIHEGFARLER